jgi:hypothetical protein
MSVSTHVFSNRRVHSAIHSRSNQQGESLCLSLIIRSFAKRTILFFFFFIIDMTNRRESNSSPMTVVSQDARKSCSCLLSIESIPWTRTIDIQQAS